MLKTSKQTKLIKDDKVIGIQVIKFTNGVEQDRFVIPVVDVRDGEDSRRKANQILKQQNIQRGSRYLKPSYSVLGRSYN